MSFANPIKKIVILGVLLLSFCLTTSSVSAASPSDSFDFEKRAEVNGFNAEKTNLEQFIEKRANKQGISYDEAANDIFNKVKKIHEKYSNKSLYNDLVNSSSNKLFSTRSVNSVPLSSVISSYALSTNDYLVTNTEEIVDGDLSIRYGVDTLLYNEGSFREFVEVYEDTAFVLPYGTGTHDWNGGYVRANKTSASKISFRAYGNLRSEVSVSVSAGFEAVGFSVSTEYGSTVVLRKSHQIAHTFSLY
ncbi:hypothetical protein [Paraliobacillus ryukyuensis]|uniref:hypothetical protein n=1 Tax=Paraliobacillus ryukyuensis TaxID=200904 RepID=UPI0009A6C233|nr:hypothetical protein [Paraliobacillus ryukyuensis]